MHENNKEIGTISIKELIKYTVLAVDKQNIFLPNIKLDEQKLMIIEKYICNTYQENNTYYIEFNSPEKSLFMTDVELLIKLNKELTNFEEKYINQIKSENIANIIKQFIYNLLDVILKLLYSLSYKKNNESSSLLLKYTNAIVNKINNRILKDINEKMVILENVHSETKNLNEYSKILDKNIDILNKNINHQSDIVENLVSNAESEKIITDTEINRHNDDKKDINNVIKNMSDNNSSEETEFMESASPNATEK